MLRIWVVRMGIQYYSVILSIGYEKGMSSGVGSRRPQLLGVPQDAGWGLQSEASGESMTRKAKDLSPDRLQASWKTAEDQGLDQLSVEEIDAEIAAARKARGGRHASEQ